MTTNAFGVGVNLQPLGPIAELVVLKQQLARYRDLVTALRNDLVILAADLAECREAIDDARRELVQ